MTISKVKSARVEQVFQLTSSRRGWLCLGLFHSQRYYFNSHPHEEDDKTCFIFVTFKSISTHILTKRMTVTVRTTAQHSLFQLTSSRRGWLTETEPLEDGEVFQLTSSRRGWLIFIFHKCIMFYFNSHPHEEDDSRLTVSNAVPGLSISTHILTKRMTQTYKQKINQAYISTHILTKRMTSWQKIRKFWKPFQLTS